MCFYQQSLAHLYRESFADVSDVAEEASKAVGGFYKDREMLCKVDGVWRAVPFQYAQSFFHYRDDWFKQAGVEVPKTFDEYIEAGKKMKKWGKPFGEAMSHEPADAGSFWYTWLWAFGGREVQADGKTVAINSPETLEAVEKGVALHDQAFVPGVLSWDGASNNRAYYAGAISGTHNGLSIIPFLKKASPQIDEATRIAALLAGPKARPMYVQAQQYAIFSYSKNIDLAKDLIRHLTKFENLWKFLDMQDGYGQGCGPKMVEGHPTWARNPRYLPVKESIQSAIGRWPGWPGPAGKAGTEAQYRFIVIDMFAKAATREMTPKEAIAWAEGQLKTIYGQA
jgi:multiple sugar transport system substrate-binding protein